MNGSTAKIINKTASTYRLKPRRLKRAYNELNHIERGEVKADMFSFCMEMKEADAGRMQRVKGEKVKVKSRKKAAGSGKRKQSKITNHKSSIIRRIVAWMMLKLRIWNFETSYRYERNLEPKKESL